MRVHLSSLATAAVVALTLSIAPRSAYAQAKTSVCKDGTTSATGRGACSGHGGVDAAKTQAAAKPASKSAKAVNAPVATAAPMKAAPAAKKEMPAPPPAKKEMAANTKAKDNKDSKGATAECKDGTYWHAASRSGSCSGHGGVAKFLTAK